MLRTKNPNGVPPRQVAHGKKHHLVQVRRKQTISLVLRLRLEVGDKLPISALLAHLKTLVFNLFSLHLTLAA